MQPCAAPRSCVQPRPGLCSSRAALCTAPRSAMLPCAASVAISIISCHVKARNTHCSISLSPSKGGGVPCHFRFETVMINIPFPRKAGKHFHSVANTISNRHQGCKPFPAEAGNDNICFGQIWHNVRVALDSFPRRSGSFPRAFPGILSQGFLVSS